MELFTILIESLTVLVSFTQDVVEQGNDTQEEKFRQFIEQPSEISSEKSKQNTVSEKSSKGTTPEKKTPVRTNPEDKSNSSPPESSPTDGQIDAVLKKMEQVQQRLRNETLDKERIGPETQQLQQEIVQQLDALIRMAEKESASQQNSQQQSSQQPMPSTQQKPKSPSTSQQNNQKSPAQNQNSQDGSQKASKGPRNENNGPQDSTNRVDSGKNYLLDLANREERIREVWGHLPPSIRQKMMNAAKETVLPQYEELVRRYYEALANQDHD